MQNLEFACVCWKLPGGRVYGMVPGTSFELVAESTQQLRNALRQALRREYTEIEDAESPLTETCLLEIPLSIQPTFDEDGRIFSSSQPIELPVHVVHGKNDFGCHSCYLPRFGAEFVFFEPEQVPVLVGNVVRNELRDLSPEKVHRYLQLAPPWLETIELRVKHDPRRAAVPRAEEEAPGLAQVADRQPQRRSVQKRLRAFPSMAWEREEQVSQAIDKLLKERANLLVVGEPGVGKSAVLLEAIQKIARRKASSEATRLPTFWKTSAHRLTAGARYFGDWQEIGDDLADELHRVRGILWIVDFVNLLRLGDQDPESSLASYWAPHLERGRFQLIGEVTPRSLEAARSLLPGFIERFQTLHVEELGTSGVLRVLDRLGEYARQNLDLEIERGALEATYRLQDRFAPYGRFPGKAVSFLADLIGEVRLSGRDRVVAADATALFVERTGLPEELVREELMIDPAELSGYFLDRIKGQPDAVERVCNTIKVFKAGLNDPDQPIATMLFAGPTGVGKSETASALAAYFFGAGQKLDPLIRLDMSEFQHPGQIERLIGTGSDPGKLVAQVRERPFCVLLLDEIEKAHPVFFDILLSVLDEGILLDAMGRETCFKGCVIVMTSNLGGGLRRSLGFGEDEPVNHEAEVRAHFRPEFFNRIDHLVTFHPLGRDAVREIVRKELHELQDREGIARRGLRLRIADSLVEWISEVGFDSRYGARPLQRAIERFVVGPLSRQLLREEVRDRVLELGRGPGEVLSIGVRDGGPSPS